MMTQIFGSTGKRAHQDSEHWMGVSDLMAGLMMVFLFIAISYMRYVLVKQEDITVVATAYQEGQVAIYKSLMNEFETDLDRWDAVIDPESLSFQFQSPEVLFDTGKIELRDRFKTILDDFFPRYLDVLSGHRESINEVRIEGHTSSRWNRSTSEDEAYFKNMWLSQGRTRAVLKHVYLIPEVGKEREWVKRNVAAVGFSSSRLINLADGSEDFERSRRVTFRVITDVEIKMRTILEKMQ
jgi:outer membrane protein OmpA-like peptidoglycan-associated protein